MSKRNRKRDELNNPVVMVRIPLWRSEWEEFRAIVEGADPTGNPIDVLTALVRAVNNGDIIVDRPSPIPRS